MAKYTLPYPPSANRYWRHVRNRTVVSKEAIAYRRDVRYHAYAHGPPELLTGPVAIEVRVYRPRKSGDLDNRLKCLIDSLQGILYVDDSQIVELHAYRDDDKHDPRVEVVIAEA